MNDRHRRIYEAALRVLAFIIAYYDVLKVYPIVVEIKTELAAATETLTGLGTEKVTKIGAAKDKTIHRGDARQHLIDLMQAITDMWRRIAPKIGGDVNRFRMPRGGDQDIIATAGSYADQAEPVKAEFTKRAFPGDFIETLQKATTTFSQTVGEADTAKREKVGTNAAFDAPAKTCKNVIDDLDPIVKMHFRDNPQVLAEWLVASHIERAPRGNSENKSKNPTPNQ
ncbi:MAG: hypothetical protein WA584_18920 [Pyrinomonadaceae bacterium]